MTPPDQPSVAPTQPSCARRRPLGWKLLAPLTLAVLLACSALGGFVPMLPEREDPTGDSFAPGCDWDRQWAMAAVGALYVRKGHLPHWDPYSGAGSPLLANPEAFVMHPAFLATASRGPAHGMRALMFTSWVALFLGLAWLGALAGVPWPLAACTGLLTVGSYELAARIGSGHLMVLGVTWWPLAAAACLDALRPSRAGKADEVIVLGTVAGASIGLCYLGGGHYPSVFALLLVLLIAWAHDLPRWLPAALLAVFLTSVFTLAAGAMPVLTIIGAGVVGAGLWRGRRSLRQRAALGAGAGLGLAAIAGARLLTGFAVTHESGRIGSSLAWVHRNDILDLSLLTASSVAALEDVLHFGHAWVWPTLIVGLALLAWRLPALGWATLIMLAVGLTAGRPSMPWGLLSWMPGMGAVNEPERLQWVALFAPLALLTPLWLLPRRWLRSHWVTLLTAVVVLLLAWQVRHDRPGWLQPGTASADPWPDSDGEMTRARGDSSRPLALGPYDGVGNLTTDLSLRFPAPPPSPGDALVRAADSSSWTAGDLSVQATLDRWTVTGPPGAEVELRQRALRGWTCDGAPSSTGGDHWLRTTLDDSGEASCRWRSPGWTAGAATQWCAALALLGGVAWRLRGWSSGVV